MNAIIVSGASASGKTYLARYLATELRIPLLARDTIKESLFDSLGHSDRDWSIRLGVASYEILFALTEEMFRSRVHAVVVEANFSLPAAAKLQSLSEQHAVQLSQVFCHATPDCLWQRFRERTHSGKRHRGHVDGLNLEEARVRILGSRQRPLALKGPLIDLDTTDFGAVDYRKVLFQIKANFEANQSRPPTPATFTPPAHA